MITENVTVTQNKIQLESHVHQEIKSLFDAQSNPDMMYQMYSTIDQNISKAVNAQKETTKTEIVRIVEFFNSLSFFESIYDFVSDAYVNYENLRHGFLTNGVLFKTEDIEKPTSILQGYTITALTKMYHESPATYEQIIHELTLQTKSTLPNGTWYFWPGCEMKIPTRATIILDTSIQKSKFVASKKAPNKNSQIVLEEKPYQLEVSMLGDCDFFHTDNNFNTQQLNAGFFAINNSHNQTIGATKKEFSEIMLELQNAEQYEYTLYVPYQSSRLDIKTNLKMMSTDRQHVEEFVATCT